MSCHNIGRGMNSVVKKTVELFDENKITTEVARDIIATCRNAIGYCDGNEDEAIKCIRKCRCGWCLKKIEKGKPLYSLWNLWGDVDSMFNNDYVLDEKDIVLASDGLCEDCFDLVISKKCKDGITPSDVKEAIINNTSIQDNLSDGVDDND